jgi:transposase InsO family protein
MVSMYQRSTRSPRLLGIFDCRISQSTGLRGSMGRRGVPYDDAKAESYMKTIKTEEVYLGGYGTFTDVIHALPHFIDYNKRRLHSALAYRRSIEFEVQHVRQSPNPCLLPGVQSKSPDRGKKIPCFVTQGIVIVTA